MRARTVDGARERGQSTVELALLLPVLVLLLLTVLQVGLVARDIVLVTHAAREAARAAAVDSARGAARAAALRGSGLRPDDLTVRVLGRTGPSGRVTVVLKYHPRSAVPLVGDWVANRTITATATMRVESRPPTTKRANRRESDNAPAHRRDFSRNERRRSRIRKRQ